MPIASRFRHSLCRFELRNLSLFVQSSPGNMFVCVCFVQVLNQKQYDIFIIWISFVFFHVFFPFHSVFSWSPILSFWKDDILWVSDDVDTHLQSVITQLPQEWHLCYLGWHGQSVLHLALGEKPTTKPMEVEDLHLGLQPGGLFVFLLVLCLYVLVTCTVHVGFVTVPFAGR